MSVIQESILLQPEELLNKVFEMKSSGNRLVQICCTMMKDGRFEISYSFDKDLEFTNLRLQITQDVEVMSISGIFFPAFLYENEIKELFGVKVINMAVDFNNGLYKKAKEKPFNDKEVAPATEN